MKIITLCGCGLGTCFILKFSAEKAAKELGIQATIVPSDISSFRMEEADLYLVPYGLDTDVVGKRFPITAIKNVISVAEVKEAIIRALSDNQRS